ncbi:7635_t:CDS:1, partial [Dentiscutata erythropus]
ARKRERILEEYEQICEVYDYYDDSSKAQELSKKDIHRFSCDFSSDSENIKYEKWKAKQEARERERILEQNEQIYDNLLRAIEYSDNPEEYSLNNLNYRGLRNGRTREKLEIAQRERCQELEKEIRNILVIGYTGNGKSTLCNVLVNKNNEFKEIFEESNGSTSKTRNIQAEVFKHKGIKYRIIDTIGFGDTKLKQSEIILAIAESYKNIENGLNQIFVVINRKFEPDKIVYVYDILRNVLFDERITDYITFVRVHFKNFEDKNKYEEDIQNIIEENNEEIVKIIESCGKRIIYVNNSSKKQKREKSREILLNHLENCQKVYKSKDLDQINKKIDMDEIENLRKKLRNIEEELRKTERDNDSKEVQSIKDEINKIEKTLLNTIGERIAELLIRISDCKIM